MTKESISFTLRKLREREHLSVKDVQEKLMHLGIVVSIKTIYGWESGKRLPDADTFLTLCDLYNSEDVLEDFGYKNKETELAAANKRTDKEITREMIQNDDNIMSSDKF